MPQALKVLSQIDLDELSNKEDTGNGKAPKAAALYIHRNGTDYQCQDCALFIPGAERCVAHGLNDVIKSYGSCGLFIKGSPLKGVHPIGSVSKIESGYTEVSKVGYSCKRCEYFLATPQDCKKVDKDSEGDDPGKILPDSCCNFWEAI